jgi:hypothetical protein
VIVEGFMGMGKYEAYFNELIMKHPNNNYFFYFDVSFSETLRRHGTRQKSKTLTEAKMYELYLKSGPSEYPGERTISELLSAERAVSLIINTTRMLNL